MEAVDYEVYTSIPTTNNYSVVLENLADFAEDHGWTVDELKVGYNWGNFGGWVTGTESFLQMHCNDILRPITWRFRTAAVTGGNYYAADYCGDVHRIYNSSTATHPINQNTALSTNMQGFKIASLNNALSQWIFGNNRWLFMVIQLNAIACSSIFFGIPNLLNNSSTVGHMIWKTCVDPTYNYLGNIPIGNNYWPSSERLAGPWSTQLSGGPGTGFAGQVTTSLYGFCGSNIRYLSVAGTTGQYSGKGFLMQRLLQLQSWSGKRFIVVPLVYSHPAPTNTFSPFAYMPIGMVKFAGLEIGQSLFYGSEEYKVFPFNSEFNEAGTQSPGRHAAWIVRVH